MKRLRDTAESGTTALDHVSRLVCDLLKRGPFDGRILVASDAWEQLKWSLIATRDPSFRIGSEHGGYYGEFVLAGQLVRFHMCPSLTFHDVEYYAEESTEVRP